MCLTFIFGRVSAEIRRFYSSDFWLPEKGFECFDLNGNPVPTSTCAFSATFDPAKSKTYKPFPNTVFNTSYGSGEYLTGGVGFDTIRIGGLTVTQQEFGVVDKAAWTTAGGVSSGLFGLAYPLLTNVYNSTDNVIYNPFFFTAVERKLVLPCAYPFRFYRLTLIADFCTSHSLLYVPRSWLMAQSC